MFFRGTNLTSFKLSMNLSFICLFIHFIVMIKTRVSYKKLTRSLYVFYWGKDSLTGNLHA